MNQMPLNPLNQGSQTRCLEKERERKRGGGGMQIRENV